MDEHVVPGTGLTPTLSFDIDIKIESYIQSYFHAFPSSNPSWWRAAYPWSWSWSQTQAQAQIQAQAQAQAQGLSFTESILPTRHRTRPGDIAHTDSRGVSHRDVHCQTGRRVQSEGVYGRRVAVGRAVVCGGFQTVWVSEAECVGAYRETDGVKGVIRWWLGNPRDTRIIMIKIWSS